MRSRSLTSLTTLVAVASLLLAVTGCSSEKLLSPAESNSAIDVAATGHSVSTTEATGTAAIQAADAGQTASTRAGSPLGGEVIESAGFEFVGLIGQVDVANSTIQFWNQDDGFAVVIGHVTDDTVLLDENGEPVNMEDFIACFSANVEGDEIAEGEIELISVEMLPL